MTDENATNEPEANPPEAEPEEPGEDEFPLSFRDALKWFVPCRTYTDRFLRIRRWIDFRLSLRNANGTANVNAVARAEQKMVFETAEEFRAYRDAYCDWWKSELRKSRRAAGRKGGKRGIFS